MKLLAPGACILTLSFVACSLFAQKHFNVVVKLPPGINIEKLEAWLDDGKQTEKMKIKPTSEQLVLTGDYYSLYAVINLQYPKDEKSEGFGINFFVQEKPALIKFQQSFKNYVLENVWDFMDEKKQMDEYSAAERKIALDYEKQYGDKLFNLSDTAVRSYYWNVLSKNVRRKNLEYVLDHQNSYYSFYTFRSYLYKILTTDSSLGVFNSFPDKFKYSDEGNYFNAFLRGRKLNEQKGTAVDFTAQDINKKTVSLSQFKGRKYVLLHFWATWCTPCMHELPALKQIGDEYKAKDLQIISVALKSSKYADYLSTLKRLHMDWINIYNDTVLFNKYGNQSTPRICLIDKNGNLVYDIVGLGDNEDFKLTHLKQVLAAKVH